MEMRTNWIYSYTLHVANWKSARAWHLCVLSLSGTHFSDGKEINKKEDDDDKEEEDRLWNTPPSQLRCLLAPSIHQPFNLSMQTNQFAFTVLWSIFFGF